jgi:hypothetical protein
MPSGITSQTDLTAGAGNKRLGLQPLQLGFVVSLQKSKRYRKSGKTKTEDEASNF